MELPFKPDYVVNLNKGLNEGPDVAENAARNVPPPELVPGMRVVLAPDGTMTPLPSNRQRMKDIEKLVNGVDFGVCTINLRQHGLVMIGDDMAARRDPPPPINPQATALYHAICIPGTTWPIRGTVVIVPDSEFA